MYSYDVLTGTKTELSDCVRVDLAKDAYLEIREVSGGVEIYSSGNTRRIHLLIAPRVSNGVIVTTTGAAKKVKQLKGN